MTKSREELEEYIYEINNLMLTKCSETDCPDLYYRIIAMRQIYVDSLNELNAMKK